MALAALAQRPRPDASPSAAQVILAAFDAWDVDRDGLLTVDEVQRAAEDSRNRGVYGAALTALLQWKEVCEGMPSLNKAWLQGYRPAPRTTHAPEGAQPTLEERRAAWEHGAALQNHFVAAFKRIQSAPHALFVDHDPILADVNQGSLGDCGYIATLGAFVVAHPEAVKRMIRPGGDGYDVTFADGMTVHLTLTDAKIGQGGASLAPGLWVVALEKAFDLRDAYDAMLHPRIEGYHDKLTPPEALTGHGDRLIRLVGNYRKSVAAEKVEAMAEDVRKSVTEAAASRRIMMANTHAPVPPGIVGGHAYALLGYDRPSDMVELWNPWGHNIGNLAYKETNGLFRLPVRDFVSIFFSVTVETDRPLFEGKLPPTIPHAHTP